MRRILLAVLLLVTLPAWALSLAELSNRDAVGGLKEALTQGASTAVAALGKTDGFWGDERVRIPLPGGIERVAKMMKTFGMGQQVEELHLTINRAAETAVVEAKPLLVDAVKKMSVQDAKGILTGGDDAGTQYFRRTTSDALRAKFLPIVKRATAKVQLADKYNALAGQAAQFKLIDEKSANLDGYVTEKALDGLFLLIAEQERAIRKDPVGAAGSLAKKVFGALGR